MVIANFLTSRGNTTFSRTFCGSFPLLLTASHIFPAAKPHFFRGVAGGRRLIRRRGGPAPCMGTLLDVGLIWADKCECVDCVNIHDYMASHYIRCATLKEGDIVKFR